MNLPALNINFAALNPFRRGEGFVALDIGSSSVKMVEAVGEKTGFRLISAGVVPLPSTAMQNNMVAEKDVVVAAIKNLIQSTGIKGKKVISVVPGRAVIIKKIQVPASEAEQLEANVEFEAQNVIPESLENVNLDYQVLGLVEQETRMDVLLVAVKKEIINSYTEVIQEAGLTPTIMDVDYFAMENMYEHSYEVKPDEVVCLIHIGARYTSINVLKNGISTFTGDLPMGGEAFTEGLMQSLQLAYDQAESFKVSGLMEGSKGSGSETVMQPDLETMLQPTSDSLAEEIGRTLSLYGAMAADEGIHSVYLSGGGAKVPGLPQLLEKRLAVPVQLCDPFHGFALGKNVDKDYIADSGLVLAIGAGLAIRRPGDK